MNLSRAPLIPIIKHTLNKLSTAKRKILLGSTTVALAGAAVYVASIDSVEDLTEIGVIRFGRAASTVARIVVDYKTSLKGLPDPSEEYSIAMRGCHTRSAERLLQLAKDNGGVFIKVGQHLAALEYLVPPEYTNVLSVLMSNAPQQNLTDVKFVLEHELGKPMNELFSDFSEKPVGAASLAQVHVAYLKETGEKVAVKVQHRRVYENSRTDINTMEILVKIADKLFPEFQFMWLVEEVKKNLPNELNFLHEANNADRARERYSHLLFLKIPRIYYNYSTHRVLTMEFCDGAQINDKKYLKDNRIDRHDLCRKLGKLISEMIFLKGYLHSDTHPGNVLVNKKPTGEVEIVLLDHGLYLDVNDHFRSLYSNLWLALLNADQQGIKEVAREMGVGELYGLFACIVARRSWKSVTQGIKNSSINRDEQKELQEYAVSLIPQISIVLSRIPREMLLILKTNDLLRNMEYILECQQRQDSMIEVSKCVVRSHHELALQKTTEKLKRLRLQLSMCWSLFRIRLYELYLVLSDNLGNVL